jgi:hypothetical protein
MFHSISRFKYTNFIFKLKKYQNFFLYKNFSSLNQLNNGEFIYNKINYNSALIQPTQEQELPFTTVDHTNGIKKDSQIVEEKIKIEFANKRTNIAKRKRKRRKYGKKISCRWR